MEAQYFNHNNRKVAFYQSKTEGQPVFLLHGNSCSAQIFEKQFNSDLAENYRLVAIDLPGHGNSEKAENPEEVYSIPGFVNVVKEAVGQLNIPNAVFIGHSLGGHILIEAAGELPQATGFMIFGTPPLGMPPAMDKAFLPNPIIPNLFKGELTDEEADQIVEAFLSPEQAHVPDFMVNALLNTDQNMRPNLGQSIGEGKYKDELEVIKNLGKPLAVLHGAKEQLINGDYFSEISIPTLWDDEVKVVSDAGHCPQWESPEMFNNFVVKFTEAVTATVAVNN